MILFKKAYLKVRLCSVLCAMECIELDDDKPGDV